MPDTPIPPRDPLTALIRYAASNLADPPRYDATNYVRCRGERLSRIIWQGLEWAVTEHGVECRDGTYAIAASRLWENWVLHMAEKDWIDLDDFAEALRIARHRHRRINPNAG
jgi:hypothetical protein